MSFSRVHRQEAELKGLQAATSQLQEQVNSLKATNMDLAEQIKTKDSGKLVTCSVICPHANLQLYLGSTATKGKVPMFQSKPRQEPKSSLKFFSRPRQKLQGIELRLPTSPTKTGCVPACLLGIQLIIVQNDYPAKRLLDPEFFAEEPLTVAFKRDTDRPPLSK